MKKLWMLQMMLFVTAMALGQRRDGDYVVTVLDYPGAMVTRAAGINNSGTVVGSHRVPPQRPFLYKNGQFSDVTFPVDTFAQGLGINDRGDIVGLYTPGDNEHGYFLGADGAFLDLQFPGATDTEALAVNNAGTIVGLFFLPDGSAHCFVYQSAQFRQFDVPGAADTICVGINNRGDVSGAWDTDINTAGHGFVLSANGNITSFDHPQAIPNGTNIDGINDRGDVSGAYVGADGVVHGFVRFKDGTLAAIDLPGAASTVARAINNAGEVVGHVNTGDGVRHGFTAVPEGSGKKL
jgi:probable HAF family extracellular repeat protein